MKTLLIIGAGPGGYECAVRAAKAGLDVHIADRANHVAELVSTKVASQQNVYATVPKHLKRHELPRL